MDVGTQWYEPYTIRDKCEPQLEYNSVIINKPRQNERKTTTYLRTLQCVHRCNGNNSSHWRKAIYDPVAL